MLPDLDFIPELHWRLAEKEDPAREEAVRLSCGEENGIPSRSVSFDGQNVLDLSAETKYPLKAGQSAILFASADLPEAGNLIASAGADYFFEFLAEGVSCISTLDDGNGGTPVSADDRVFRIPVRKGLNHFAFFIRAGMGGWKAAIRFHRPSKNVLRRFSFHAAMCAGVPQSCELRYGPWITHASATEASVRFTTSGFFACAIDIRKKTEKTWKRFYELWNGCLRFDTDRHAIHLTDLAPGSEYEFKIVLFPKKESRNGSLQLHPQLCKVLPEIHLFRSLPGNDRDLTVYVMADTHMPGGSRLGMLQQYDAAWDFGKADLFVHLGDISSSLDFFDDEVLGGFAEFFRKGDRLIPLCMVRGNHEHSGRESGLWNPTFSAPDGKSFYAFRAGNAFFIVLDYWAAGDDGTNLQSHSRIQENWIRTVLRTPECRDAAFRIVFNHCPAGECSKEPPIQAVHRFLLEMNRIAPIDLFLAGHVHAYGRSMTGITRVVTLKGGERASALNLTEVRITPNRLFLKSGDEKGRIFDSLEIAHE